MECSRASLPNFLTCTLGKRMVLTLRQESKGRLAWWSILCVQPGFKKKSQILQLG
jgi:hypothetical protein